MWFEARQNQEERPMIESSIREEILSEVDRLNSEQQRRVLEFARSLASLKPAGVPGKELLSFAGTIELDDLLVMSKVIEDDCEQVRADEW
jgi:hypothetical protein